MRRLSLGAQLGIGMILVLGFFIWRGFLQVQAAFHGSNQAGNSKYEEGDFASAAQNYEEMIRLQPDKTDGYFLRGMAYSRQGRHDRAIADYTRVIEMQRNKPDSATYYNRGLAHAGRGEWEEAHEDYDTAYTLDKNNVDALENRGAVAIQRSDYASAIADLSETVRRVGPKFGTLLLRAEAYSKTKEYGKAAQDMQQAAGLQPNTSLAWGNLGWYQYLNGQVGESIESSKHALEINPKSWYARCNLALAYATQGKWEDAKANYDESLPFCGAAERQAAIQDIRDALQKHPNVPALQKARAYCASIGEKVP